MRLADGSVDEPQVLFLNDLLNLPQPADLRPIYDVMDNETRNRGKRETVCRLLRRTSASRPVLVEIENIQWADGVTLAHLGCAGRDHGRSAGAADHDLALGR